MIFCIPFPQHRYWHLEFIRCLGKSIIARKCQDSHFLSFCKRACSFSGSILIGRIDIIFSVPIANNVWYHMICYRCAIYTIVACEFQDGYFFIFCKSAPFCWFINLVLFIPQNNRCTGYVLHLCGG